MSITTRVFGYPFLPHSHLDDPVFLGDSCCSSSNGCNNSANAINTFASHPRSLEAGRLKLARTMSTETLRRGGPARDAINFVQPETLDERREQKCCEVGNQPLKAWLVRRAASHQCTLQV